MVQQPEHFDNTEPLVNGEETFALLAEPSSAMASLIRWARRRVRHVTSPCAVDAEESSPPRPRIPRQTAAERQMGSRLHEGQIVAIVADHKAGLAVSEIAQHRGTSRSTVVKYLRLRGFDVAAASKYTVEQIEEFARLYVNEGKTQAQIGELFDIGADTVMRALALKGIGAKDRGRDLPRRMATLPGA